MTLQTYKRNFVEKWYDISMLVALFAICFWFYSKIITLSASKQHAQIGWSLFLGFCVYILLALEPSFRTISGIGRFPTSTSPESLSLITEHPHFSQGEIFILSIIAALLFWIAAKLYTQVPKLPIIIGLYIATTTIVFTLTMMFIITLVQ